MRRFWQRLFGLTAESRESRRDPDLDYMKMLVENHELQIQELNRDLDAISGGTRPRTERRVLPRPPRH